MPSPFPGMDPYLEGEKWIGMHHALSSEIARQLMPKLVPKYVARPMEYFVMEVPEDFIATTNETYPDVGIYGTAHPRVIRESIATWTPTLPIKMATIISEKVPHVRIEIRDVAHQELVTAIEVLSITNKRGKGYEKYVEKRSRILRSVTHLLEIDLLRQGKRVPMQQTLPNAPYFVFLGRAFRSPVIEVWPIRLQDSLPTVPVPLRNDDPDVLLDLRLALTTTYDTFGYGLTIDYTRPPAVPLEGEDAIWAKELLRATGFAPANLP